MHKAAFKCKAESMAGSKGWLELMISMVLSDSKGPVMLLVPARGRTCGGDALLRPMQLGYWGWEEQVDIALPGPESSFCPEGFAQKLKWSWGGRRGEKLEEEEAEEPGAQAWP